MHFEILYAFSREIKTEEKERDWKGWSLQSPGQNVTMNSFPLSRRGGDRLYHAVNAHVDM